jgi:hypothetical protein
MLHRSTRPVRPRRRLGLQIAAALAAVALAGCAEGGLGPLGEGEASRSVGRIGGFTTDPGTPKDWVVAGRSDAPTTYMPVGVTPPDRPTPSLDVAALAAREAELDALRARSAALARRPLPPGAGATPEQSIAATLAEQRRRLAAAGLARPEQARRDAAARETALRREAQDARDFATRPFPEGSDLEPPASWPVPAHRRRKPPLPPASETAPIVPAVKTAE